MSRTKFVVITGGVLSGIGKGTATAAISRLLQQNRKVVSIKCDGYLNVDPGTMNPVEHGEVFVLEDGGEVDMDFGHYERFLGVPCKFDWNLTSGKIFNRVIERERRGDFLGKTIQIVPHVINEIQQWWFEVAEREKADIMTIEIGGTVGDWENSWFVEAARQLKHRVEDVVYIHLTYVPYLDSVGEAKSKPAQRDVALLWEKGIRPDIIIARSKSTLSPKIKEKLALFCDVAPKQVISAHDVETVYDIPLMFDNEGILDILGPRLGITGKSDLVQWRKLVERIKAPRHCVTIAIGGKYTELRDSYASIIEALRHSGANTDTRVLLRWIESTDIENGKLNADEALAGVDGLLVPGGFGSRGTEGKIAMIQHARENGIPYLGICYGLQLAVIEFARSVCGLQGASSTEIDSATPHPVVDILPEQKTIDRKGGTMRRGAYEAMLVEGTLVRQMYGTPTAVERHRHRYEVNPSYHETLKEHGMSLCGLSPDGRLVEFIELPSHPYFVATQAHNELTSRLEAPNPLFLGLVQAALARSGNRPLETTHAEKDY